MAVSDCRIPMPSYKAPTHTREQDELRVTAHFKDGLHPQDFVANRDTPSGTRVLDYLESDGERFERVRECHVVSEYSYHDHTIPEWNYDYCSNCGGEFYDEVPNYCPNCGAKVKVGE